MILPNWIPMKEIVSGESTFFGTVVKGKMINLVDIIKPQLEHYLNRGYSVDDLTLYENENEEFKVVSINEIKEIELECVSFEDWVYKTTRKTIDKLKEFPIWLDILPKLEKEYNEFLEMGYLPIELTILWQKGKKNEVLPVYAVHNLKMQVL